MMRIFLEFNVIMSLTHYYIVRLRAGREETNGIGAQPSATQRRPAINRSNI